MKQTKRASTAGATQRAAQMAREMVRDMVSRSPRLAAARAAEKAQSDRERSAFDKALKELCQQLSAPKRQSR